MTFDCCIGLTDLFCHFIFDIVNQDWRLNQVAVQYQRIDDKHSIRQAKLLIDTPVTCRRELKVLAAKFLTQQVM